MPTLQELQAQDDAWSKQYDAEQAATKQKPEPTNIFMADLGDRPVTDEIFHGALNLADNMSRGDGGIYRYVRTQVLALWTDYKRGDPLQDALIRLAIPLLGLARMLDHIGHSAVHAQAHADAGTQPVSVRFADTHSLIMHTQKEFLGALKAAPHGHHLVNVFIEFLAGTITEHERAVDFLKAVHTTEEASLLGAAADVIKQGAEATRTAMAWNARSVDDLATFPTPLQPRTSEHGHGMHLTDSGIPGRYIPTPVEEAPADAV